MCCCTVFISGRYVIVLLISYIDLFFGYAKVVGDVLDIFWLVGVILHGGTMPLR